MMNIDRIVIHEQAKELAIGMALLLLDGYLLVDHWTTNFEIDTHYGFFATTLVAPFLIVVLTLRSIKNKGTIIISEKYVKASYWFKKNACLISLSEPVYYATYVDIEDGNKYILISNEKFLLAKRTIETTIDYDTQIPIQYTKRIESHLPKEDWIEIKQPDK